MLAWQISQIAVLRHWTRGAAAAALPHPIPQLCHRSLGSGLAMWHWHLPATSGLRPQSLVALER